MIVQCPNCQRLLRPGQLGSSAGLTILCPICQLPFKVKSHPLYQALIAHEDYSVCSLLEERVVASGGTAQICPDVATVLSNLNPEWPHLVLLDVAFDGSFPFQLIDHIKGKKNPLYRIVLLPSVYSRTAYKKRPESLYGADAYLELHHIGDRLVPMVADLFPELAKDLKTVDPVFTVGDERPLQDEELAAQAESLAGVLVADILLYHQQLLTKGLETGRTRQLFAVELAEARQLLEERLPAARDLGIDFIGQAFEAACRSYTGS